MKDFKGVKLLTGLLSVMLIVGFSALNVLAGVPKTVSYQGELANSSADSVTMTFSLFDNEDGEGLALWTEEDKAVTVVNGVVSTILGDNNEISESVLSEATHLGIQINGGALMKPLSVLTSSIFAMRALVADRLAADAQVVTLNYAQPGSVKAGDLAENSVEAYNIQENSVSSLKTFESVHNVNPSAEGESYELTKVHQGLVLVSGETVIKLEQPSAENNGQKFTIKKIDEGLQRYGGKEEPGNEPCEIKSDYVEIIVGDGSVEWFDDQTGKFKTNNKFIENRTNKVVLEYKNAYATFISNGSTWYITDSNPPVDIINPVPGGNGIIDSPEDLTTGPISLSLTPASDCDLQSCDSTECSDNLYYMPVFSKFNKDKLRTVEEVLAQGYKCYTDWITDVTDPIVCNPNSFGFNSSIEVKMNVVVRDSSGNLSVYNPPGDITPPGIIDNKDDKLLTTVNPPGSTPSVYLEFYKATDTISDDDTEITYSLYFSKGDSSACLDNLDENRYPTSSNDCQAYTAFANQNIDDQYTPGPTGITTLQPGLLADDSNKLGYDVYTNYDKSVSLEGGESYWFTVVAEDKAGNRKQYKLIYTSPR